MTGESWPMFRNMSPRIVSLVPDPADDSTLYYSNAAVVNVGQTKIAFTVAHGLKYSRAGAFRILDPHTREHLHAGFARVDEGLDVGLLHLHCDGPGFTSSSRPPALGETVKIGAWHIKREGSSLDLDYNMLEAMCKAPVSMVLDGREFVRYELQMPLVGGEFPRGIVCGSTVTSTDGKLHGIINMAREHPDGTCSTAYMAGIQDMLQLVEGVE